MAPENLRYTETHEWVELEGNKAKFGLTDHAVKEIKDIVYLDIKPVGSALKAGEPFGAVETVKAAFDLNSPLSGKLAAVNGEAQTTLDLVSRDPYGKGWLVQAEISDPTAAAREMASLMDAAAYAAHCAKGGHH